MAGMVFSVLRQVLAETQEKLASEEAHAKEASAKTKQAQVAAPVADDDIDPEKVAEACEFLADNLHEVVDNRTQREKLAEYAEIQHWLQKRAEAGDEGKGPHQTQRATADATPPMNPATDSGVNPGGPNSAMAATETNTPGGSILNGGDSGDAIPRDLPPKTVDPSENAYPTDGGNALQTNRTEVPGGSGEMPEKIAQARAAKLAGLVACGAIRKEAAAILIRQDLVKVAQAKQKLAAAKAAKKLPEAFKAHTKSAPKTKKAEGENFVSKLIAKFAEDAINPAQISGETTPVLQTAAGVPSAQSQGSEAGENTPDTRGSDPGRSLVTSVEAAINATKREAKQSARSEMASYLNEPALSQAHDNVLSKSLENTPSAGVKIASARALLQKWASQSPDHQRALEMAVQSVKQANAELGADGAEAAMPGAANPGGLSTPLPGETPSEGGEGGPMAAVSDGALAAAAQGVTPEELASAEALLAEQQGAAEMAADASGGAGAGMGMGMPPGMPPPAAAAPPMQG